MKLKKFLCVCLCLLVVFANSRYVLGVPKQKLPKEEKQIVSRTDKQKVDVSVCDKRLADMGTPQEVIDSMDANFKSYIYEKSENTETYEGFDENLMENENSTGNNLLNARIGTISTSDMSVKVYATGVKFKGKKYVKIYPAFEWKTSCDLDNDTFAFALYDDWECKTGDEVGLTLNLINGKGVLLYQTTLKPASASSSGYGFKIPSNYASQLMNGAHYEGYAYFYVKENEEATRTISIKYIHDTTSPYSVSYGVSIGPASISVTGSTDRLEVYARNLNFSYYFSSK